MTPAKDWDGQVADWLADLEADLAHAEERISAGGGAEWTSWAAELRRRLAAPEESLAEVLRPTWHELRPPPRGIPERLRSAPPTP